MKLNRRQLFAAGASGAASLRLLPAAQPLLPLAVTENHVAVIIQLRGGNDWMNTVSPAQSPVYQAARPGIRITPAQGLPAGTSTFNGPLFLHPAMTGLKRLWDAGKVALVSGVGYPGQSLSHFESEDVWYSASPNRTLQGGWLGRYFRSAYTGGYDIPALLAQSEANGSFSGFTVPSLNNPQFLNIRTDPASVALDGLLEQQLMVNNVLALRPAAGPNLAHVKNILEAVMASAARFAVVGANYAPRVAYPAAPNPLSGPLQLIARYITGGSTQVGNGLDTQCYYFATPSGTSAMTGFDSHAGQGGAAGQQANLLREISDAVEAFVNDLVAWGHSQRVVVMIWTEFGRRVGENGSGGTDHGEAGGVILCGDPIVGGNYGVYPNLANLRPPFDQVNASPTVDFRDVYATLLERWFGVPSTSVIPGWNRTLLGFLP